MAEFPHVLVADSSRVIRTLVARNLKEHFEIREEAGGDDAWQTLVLDSSIIAVIAGINLPRLDGFGLVERLRANKLRRLHTMPFFLIVSDAMSEEERQQALMRGVTDFVPKGLGTAETERIITFLLDRVRSGDTGEDWADPRSEAPAHTPETAPPPPPEPPPPSTAEVAATQSLLGVSDILGQMGHLAGFSDTVQEPRKTDPGILDRQEIDAYLAIARAPGNESVLGVLTFGLDSYIEVGKRFGQEMAGRIESKFAQLLAKKIRPEDSIGRLAPGRVAILAPGTDLALCAAFAGRVCKSLAAAQISIRGQRIDMTVSVGVASFPEDGALSGESLLSLADGRMETAIRAGGNQVVTRPVQSAKNFDSDAFMEQLDALLGTLPSGALTANLGKFGLKLVPIFKQMEQSLHLGLPIDEIERKLWDRARAERQTR